MASTRTIALAATGVLAVVAAAVIGASLGSDGPSTSTGESSVVPSVSSTRTPGAVATGGTRGGATGAGTASGGPGGATGGATGGAGPGLEVLPSPAGDPSSASTGYSLPPVSSTRPAPLLGDTLPRPAVAKGRLVDGFPAALAPPKGTSVESSSVSVAGDVLQAALIARGGDAQRILLHYRSLLSTRGFAEKQAQGVENAPGAAFTKGRDNVTVMTQDGKTYLLANLRPKGA